MKRATPDAALRAAEKLITARRATPVVTAAGALVAFRVEPQARRAKPKRVKR